MKVAAGLIAVATSVITYIATDVDGRPIADPVTFQKGDVIHDEALVQELHEKHFHHALTVSSHSEHLCPEDCVMIADVKAQAESEKPPIQVPPAVAPPSIASAAAATVSNAAAVEVK